MLTEYGNDNSIDLIDEEAEQDAGIWLSIGDLMSGLLLFFALLFITTQGQLFIKVEELKQKEEELKKYQEAFENLPLIVMSAIEQGLGGNSIEVDPETGDVNLSDRILFEEGESQLKSEGKVFLKEFIPLYSKVIFSEPEFDQQIVRVVIEGHTSSKGSDQANRALSLERALSVSNYIFSEEINFPNHDKFRNKVLVAGRGEIDAEQSFDNPKDRKVTFRFQLHRPDLSNILKDDLKPQLEEKGLDTTEK